MRHITRRRFIQRGLGVGGTLLLPWPVRPVSGGKLAKYVEPLPVPGAGIVVAAPSGPNAYAFTQRQIYRQLHPDLPPTPLWAYDDGSGLAGQAGSFGMAVVAHSGIPLSVSFTHALPATYPEWLPVDTRLTPLGDQVRLMTHLHGGFVAADSDGNPAITPNGFGPGETQNVFYTNQQPQMPASLLWFHDHGLGATRLNVFAGLAAAYLLRDEFDTGTEPDPIGIPGGAYEIPLVMQDRQFNLDGTFLYPTSDVPGLIWIGEYFGNVMLVNGKVWPFLEVEARKYRFRILNGSNARFYHLQLVAEGGSGVLPFVQIGADEGFLPRSVQLTDLLIAPAERFDVIVDFSACTPGQRFVLTNDALAPYPFGPDDAPDPAQPGTTGQVMQFRVVKRIGQDRSSMPAIIGSGLNIPTAKAIRERTLMLSESASALDNVIMGQLGGSPLNATPDNPTGGLHWDDPVTEDPRAGTTEIWNIVNATGDAHPIHVHLVQFQVLGRQAFNLSQFFKTGEVVPEGAFIPPDANELFAPKDTVKAHQTPARNKGLVTRIIMTFDLPGGAAVTSGQRLPYVWHCHILEHEDNDMMRPYDVVV